MSPHNLAEYFSKRNQEEALKDNRQRKKTGIPNKKVIKRVSLSSPFDFLQIIPPIIPIDNNVVIIPITKIPCIT